MLKASVFQTTVYPDWQHLFDFHFVLLNMDQIYVWAASVPAGTSGFTAAVVNFPQLSSSLPLSSLWKVKNTLAASSFENRATLKPSEVAAEPCVCWEFSRSTSPGATQIQFPLSGFQKQRNSRENQGRTSLRATTTTPASLALPHTSTELQRCSMWTFTQHTFMDIISLPATRALQYRAGHCGSVYTVKGTKCSNKVHTVIPSISLVYDSRVSLDSFNKWLQRVLKQSHIAWQKTIFSFICWYYKIFYLNLIISGFKTWLFVFFLVPAESSVKKNTFCCFWNC